MGLGCLAVGLASHNQYYVALAGMALAGGFNPIANGPISALFQSAIEPGMQGRVMGLMSSLSMLASPLGMAIAGPLSDSIGVSWWYRIGGIACVLLAIWPLFARRDAHRGRTSQPAPKHPHHAVRGRLGRALGTETPPKPDLGGVMRDWPCGSAQSPK